MKEVAVFSIILLAIYLTAAVVFGYCVASLIRSEITAHRAGKGVNSKLNELSDKAE